MGSRLFPTRKISDGMNNTFIVLIPKNNQPHNFDGFRLISMCNFSDKVVAKIIAIRLGTAVSKIISQNQGDFVKGI